MKGQFSLSESAKAVATEYGIPLSICQREIRDSFSEDCPQALSSEYLLIRHGFSEQNLLEKIVQKSNKDFTMDDAHKYPDYFLGEQHLDARLHEIGIAQCLSQTSIVAGQSNITAVFISPLRRAIQTCIYMFSTHPNRETIRFILVPQLSECLCSTGCFSPYTLTEYKLEMDALAASFQITLDYSKVEEFGETWQIKTLEDPEIQQRILDKVQQFQENTDDTNPYLHAVLDEIKAANNYIVESFPLMYKKSCKAKKILADLRKEFPQQIASYVIVSHGFLMRCLTATIINDRGSPQNGHVFSNAEIYCTSL